MSATVPIINPHTEDLIRAASKVLAAVDRGDLSADYPLISNTSEALDAHQAAQDRACEALDELEAACTAAEAYATQARQSPFKRHRDAILHNRALSQLVAHLYNGGSALRLGEMFMSLAPNQGRVAVELIESYSRRGENDRDFMALARDIVLRRHEEAR